MGIRFTTKERTTNTVTKNLDTTTNVMLKEKSWELENHQPKHCTNDMIKGESFINREGKEAKNILIEALLSYYLHKQLMSLTTPYLVPLAFKFILNPLGISALPAIIVHIVAFVVAAFGIYFLRKLLVWIVKK